MVNRKQLSPDQGRRYVLHPLLQENDLKTVGNAETIEKATSRFTGETSIAS